jgi:hypothetical protein
MSFWLQYPKLQFDEEKHVYTWLGTPKKGVTSVLSSVGTKKDGYWKPIGFDDSFLRGDTTAADFGHAFHKVCAIILRGGIPQFPDAIKPWVTQFNRFLKEWNISPLCDIAGNPIVEYPLYSQRMDVAGTMDLLAYFGAKQQIAVFDWKSSTSQQDHWRSQTATYAAMAREVFGIKYKILHIPVRFDERGYYPDIRTNHPEDLILFQSCLNILRAAA